MSEADDIVSYPHDYIHALLAQLAEKDATIERLRTAVESAVADLTLVEASFDEARDPMAAIDAPAWLDNALSRLRAVLSSNEASG